MIPRLITVVIFLFCGTMTTLLVRSVIFPEGSGLAKVSPRVAFDYFAARSEGSNLDVWEGNHITGSCQITPHGAVSRPEDGTDSVKVSLSILIRLPQAILNSETIKLTGDAILHSDGRVDDLDLEMYLPGSLPRVSLAISQPAGKASPSLTLKRANEVLFSTEGGNEQDGLMAMMVENMLKGTGLSLDALTETADAAEESVEVRTGYFEAGGTRRDGFLLSSGGDPATRFDLYMENTGEVLRIDTPLTGENQLGLRFLAESLRPPGTPDPNLDEFQFLRRLRSK
jgi:hypothetical protein